MCGIIAIFAPAADVSTHLVDALSRLEYRGYDSAGITVADRGGYTTLRTIDRVDRLRDRLSELSEATHDRGIGHTRWATHGGISEANAHPHRDDTGRVALVHNGIIENAAELRDELVALGHRISSPVDSEVVAHLIADRLRDGAALGDAIRDVTTRIRGSWALAVLDTQTGALAVTAHASPLVVARSGDRVFAASDIAAIGTWVDTYQVLDNDDIVVLDGERGLQWTRPSESPIPTSIPVHEQWRTTPEPITTEGDRMAAEIVEQPDVVTRVLDAYSPHLLGSGGWPGLANFRRVAVLGCGTSLNAGAVIASTFSRLGSLPSSTIIASEARGLRLEPETLVIAISQSGETADVLRALEELNPGAGSLLALTNNAHSTLGRRSDALIDCLAGPEIGVAATKTFTAQVVAGLCLAVSSISAQGDLPRSIVLQLLDDLWELPSQLEQAIATSEQRVPELIDDLVDHHGCLVLGRGAGVPYAHEGALKIKELTYRWAQSYPAGELKHGPLALIEQGTPVFVVDHGDPRLATGISEVSARGAHVVRIGGVDSTIPALGPNPRLDTALGRDVWGPLEAIIPLQVIARSLALRLGNDVDKPRNLAKSVTVE